MIVLNYEIVITLQDILDKRGKTRYWLSKETGIHFKTIDSYYKNKIRRYEADSLLKICVALDCQISDIIKIIKN